MKTFAIALPLVLAACASTPAGPPADVAHEIVAALDVGRVEAADDAFAAVGERAEYRDKIYPVLFTAAGERFETGEGDAVPLLRFLAAHYPDAIAVREALVYGLFLERAEQVTADPELVQELETTAAELRERGAPATPWLDLVDAQVAIDRGRTTEARVAFDQFLVAWNGSPNELWPYVEDLERYLTTH
ncbi:MAG: hypothetical protein E2O39_06155 [Planctomycetota bacterium]|nr:MAG: hypothetical protein E2O39_06155 [Planctomycetota bacterium]